MRIGYARVSTLDQNPELQLEKLREAGCEKVVVEKASGARADRPELTRLLRDMLREGDTLVIWKLDRLARSLKQLIETADDLKGRGIGLVSLTDAIDTASPGGMLVFHMLGAIAEFERALIRERTTAGLAEARRKGSVALARVRRSITPSPPRITRRRETTGSQSALLPPRQIRARGIGPFGSFAAPRIPLSLRKPSAMI